MSDEPKRESGKESNAALGNILGFRLRRLQGLLSNHWNRWFKALDISVTPVQGGILLLINENPGISQVMLGRLLKIEAPTLLQSLKPLLEAKLVRRYRSLEDGRALSIYLTKHGRSVTATIEKQTPLHEADLARGLSEKERQQLIALLNKAIVSAEEAVSDLARAEAAAPTGVS